MKKLFLSLVAIAAMVFASSCQQEKMEAELTGGSTVTFTVEVPEAAATRALGDDVSNINDLVYAVYSTSANSLDEVKAGEVTYELLYQKNYAVNPFNGSGRAVVEVELVNDKNYFVIFWAQVNDTWVAGDNFNLTSVSYPEEMTANNNNYAAFSGISFLSKGNLSAKKQVNLKRPFAQLNIGTKLADNFVIDVTESYVKVNNAGTSFNLIKQQAEGCGSVEFNQAAVPTNPDREDGKLSVNNTEYKYVAMNYVFANGNVEVEYEIFTQNHGSVKNTVANVPVAANYRTNIVGKLLTSTTDYNVVLDGFDTNDNSGTVEVLTEGIVKNQNGDYEVSNENGLVYMLNNLFKEYTPLAEGGNFYLTQEMYDLSGFAVNSPSVPAGKTLNIYGETPVVTRAAEATTFAGITIKGLTQPFIDKVEGTVAISGVNIPESGNDESILIKEITEEAEVIVADVEVKTLAEKGDDNILDASNVVELEQLQQALASGIKEINITKALNIENGKTVTISLNGKTVKGVDNATTSSFGLINVNPGADLTISGPGSIKLSAVNNRGWNAYSSVVSNQRGTLTVNGDAVIEHLGGTDMAYGIDNLTNTGAEIAKTTIENATVKSPYRAIRQFLNGTGLNELYVNENAVIEGTNKSIWMQDANSNSNPGKLVVNEDAVLNGDVYLFVTAGSTQWPVEVSIAKSALVNSEVLTGNVPYQYDIFEQNGAYVVGPSWTIDENGNAAIYSANGLRAFAADVNAGDNYKGKTVTLVADIDLNNEQWTSAGTEKNNFSGEFNGNGKTIKNLTIVETEAKEGKAYIGLFGYAKDATIKNVTFENVNINIACLDIDHSQGHIGAVAGSLEGTSTIQDVTVKGDIKVEATLEANGASRVAVVAGGNAYGNVTMKNVHVIANEGSYLKANNNLGALAGQLQGVSVFEDCSSNIDVTGYKFFAGGIIGIAAGDQNFTNCHTTGDVTILAGRTGRANDHYRVGGIAGGWADGKTKVCTLTNCSFGGKISGTNADGSVAKVLDYAGYVGRGYTLTNCAGSKVVIDGVEYVQVYDDVYGIYAIGEVVAYNNAYAIQNVLDKKYDVLLDQNYTFSAKETTANSGYGATGLTVNGSTLDGNGKTIKVENAGATWDCAIYAQAGTIKNMTVSGAMRGIFMGSASGDVYINNVTFANVIYTFNSDGGNKNYGVYISNSTLNGWTSFSNVHKEVVFTDCSFGKGSGYAFCRPYNPCVFENCEFSTDMEFDTAYQSNIVFKNCTYGGVKITAENAASLKTGDVTFFYNGVGTVKFE